jgi:RecA/RadA recombinase
MDLVNILNIQEDQFVSRDLILNSIKKSQEVRFRLSINSINFDSIIGGGFYPHQKYLIFGSNKQVKSIILHQICVQAFKFFSPTIYNPKNRKHNFIYYLDTENIFRPERIKDIANGQNLDYKKVLKNIVVAKIMSNSALLLKLKEIENRLETNFFYLLIIDGINNFYRSEQGNKYDSFFNIKTTFLKNLKQINDLVNKFNLITIATAQISPNFASNAIISDIPVGNQFLNHYFSEYLYLNMKEDINYVHLVNSQFLPEKKVSYKITSKGIEDYKI